MSIEQPMIDAEMPFKERSKVIGRRWRCLPAHERAIWIRRAAEEDRKFHEEHPTYGFQRRRPDQIHRRNGGKKDIPAAGPAATLSLASEVAPVTTSHDKDHNSEAILEDNAAAVFENKGMDIFENNGEVIYNPIGEYDGGFNLGQDFRGENDEVDFWGIGQHEESFAMPNGN
ncbi:hypothetical protein MGN70_013210 [Eutypa lata]|nr:hypothetical protein MGN70_013210 [Eutypa lata]